MFDLTSLLTIAIAFFIAAASPGPATFAVATVSMHSGRKSGLFFGAGLALGLAVWGLVAATGLGAILQASSYALSVLKLVGGAYLLWLASMSARSAMVKADMSVPPKSTRHHGFRHGLVLNLSNPKAVIAWMALGLDDGGSAAQVMLATGTCMVLGLAIYMLYALVFSTSGAMALYRKTRRWIDGAVAGLFAAAGIGLIRSAFVKQ
mgnify:CR=1 FL=1